MKTKDIVALLIAVVIFLVAGYLAYTQLAPKSSAQQQSAGAQVEVVGSIPSGFDSSALSQLGDTTKVRDYAEPVDLTTGLNNQSVFGQ